MRNTFLLSRKYQVYSICYRSPNKLSWGKKKYLWSEEDPVRHHLMLLGPVINKYYDNPIQAELIVAHRCHI